jgi:hypothetical protein
MEKLMVAGVGFEPTPLEWELLYRVYCKWQVPFNNHRSIDIQQSEA